MNRREGEISAGEQPVMNAVVVVTSSVSNWLITKMIVQILDWMKKNS